MVEWNWREFSLDTVRTAQVSGAKVRNRQLILPLLLRPRPRTGGPHPPAFGECGALYLGRRRAPATGALMIQLQQPLQHLGIRKRRGPPVGRKDRLMFSLRSIGDAASTPE
jgi:hypothetical protein